MFLTEALCIASDAEPLTHHSHMKWIVNTASSLGPGILHKMQWDDHIETFMYRIQIRTYLIIFSKIALAVLWGLTLMQNMYAQSTYYKACAQ